MQLPFLWELNPRSRWDREVETCCSSPSDPAKRQIPNLSFCTWVEKRHFFQAVKVLQFSILCFPISHSNTVCYSHRPLSDQILHNRIIIRCRFFFLFIGREPTTLPVNDCLQIIVCSCAMTSTCVWLQMIFCSCVSETTFSSFLRSLLLEIGRSLRK